MHTHDPEAARCPAATQARCEAAVVFEEFVWPVVPTAIDGERVYRAPDWDTFESLDGTFLFGGFVSVLPSSDPSCDPVTGRSEAERRFIVFCDWTAIDGRTIAPGSAFTGVEGSIVVVRAHVNDPVAAQCPDYLVSDCERTIVVDSVLASYLPYSAEYARPAPARSGSAAHGAPVTLREATYPFGAARAS